MRSTNDACRRARQRTPETRAMPRGWNVASVVILLGIVIAASLEIQTGEGAAARHDQDRTATPTASPTPPDRRVGGVGTLLEVVGRLGSFGQAGAVVADGSEAWVAQGRALQLVRQRPDGLFEALAESEVISHTIRDLALMEDVVYAAAGEQGLVVFDRDPPLGVVHAIDTPGTAVHIAVSSDGALAFVADELGGVRILDLADPTRPEPLGDYDTVRSSRVSAPMRGRLLVGEWDAFEVGLAVVDVRRPSRPQHVAFLAEIGRPQSLAVRDDIAYIPTAEGLLVLDASGSEIPRVVWPTPGADIHLAPDRRRPDTVIRGDLVYVAGWTDGVLLFDVSDAVRPVRLGRVDTPGESTRLAVTEDRLWVADGTGGLRLYDRSDPRAPRFLSDHGTRVGQPVALATEGDMALVADAGVADPPRTDRSGGAIVALDVTEHAEPSVSGHLDMRGVPRDVAVHGGVAYAAIASADCQGGVPRLCGLAIADFSDPTAPVQLGVAVDEFPARAVATDGEWAWLLTAETRHFRGGRIVSEAPALRVIDVSKPLQPADRGSLELSDPRALAVDGRNGLAFVADGRAGFRVIDISDPRNPAQRGVLEHAEDVVEVALLAGRPWVAAGDSLRPVDVSDPWRPVGGPATRLGGAIKSLSVAPSSGRLLASVAGDDGSPGGLRVMEVGTDDRLVEYARWTGPAPAAVEAHRDGYLAAIGQGAVYVLGSPQATPTTTPPRGTPSPTPAVGSPVPRATGTPTAAAATQPLKLYVPAVLRDGLFRR